MRLPRHHLRACHLWLALCLPAISGLVLTPHLVARQQNAKSATTVASAPQEAQLSPALKQLLARAFDLRDNNQRKESRQQFEQALASARVERNPWAEAEAHRGLGLLLYDAAQYPSARAELEEALLIFLSLNDAASAARMRLYLGALAGEMGNRAKARDLSQEALSEFSSLGDLRGQVQALLYLVYTEGIPENEIAAYRQQGLDVARKVGDHLREGLFLHQWGDHLFADGDFAGALAKLQEAAACFEDVRAQLPLSRVLNSLGRLHRAHGSYEEALRDYQRALAIQQDVGDQEGVIQSLNAEGDAYSFLGKQKESIEHYERALALARQTGSPRAIAVMTGNLGEAYINLEEYARAIELLKESLRLDPSSFYAGNRYTDLSRAYRSIGRYDMALESAGKGVDLCWKEGRSEYLSVALRNRALASEKLQQFSEALSDIQEAIRSVEQLRAKLVPADYLKQGYAERTQDLFVDAIQIHEQLGHHKEAMVVAEEARARAFLDLLASRGFAQNYAQSSDSAAANHSPGSLPSTRTAPGVTQEAGIIGLTTRGSTPLKLGTPGGALMLPSLASAAPPSFDQLVSTAKRLDSTLLSYWVAQDTTFIWLLRPDGTLRSERVRVSSEHLSKLIRATSYGEEEPHTEPTALVTAHPQAPASSAARGAQVLPLRGGGELLLGGHRAQSWRELYNLLILPVQESLPPRGSHLTIVPQGPLFRLSFAALQDAHGHYLVENYALNYAPSLGVLRLTGERRQRLGQREPRYLIVADPLLAPDLSKDTGLPPLPGARQEARNLVRLLPRGETTLLVGSEATKQAVREAAAGKTVLHLATHAIVRDDQPLDSFLVLSAGDNSPPGSGRLTVQEIYGMDLQTDLVVLSACSTALGKLSGDGMAGLTRAFFYAGAPSVVATLWDVADEPTSLLVSNLYASLQKGHDKSRALRTAQLRLIQALRAGRVQVNTPAGLITLPEDPVFWAGFVLQGEP